MRKFLRLEAQCPRCQLMPALRIPEKERERHSSDDPKAIVLSYKCGCGAVYPIRAYAYQNAA